MGRDKLTLVHMGDSITFGQYVDPALRWTSLVGERLAGGPVRVESLNRGVSGETTRQGLERFAADVQAAEPEVVTIQFGLNDCNRWESDRGLPRVSPRAFAANLVEMIERARAFGAREIVLATNHRTLRPAEYERDNAYYSELTREVATEAGAHLCDIRSAFEPFSEQELAELLLPAPDILHLSVAGNRVYADAIEPFVKRAVAAAAGIGPEVARA